MKPDCPNDCIEKLLFPKRPNNRPGLLHIDYRIGTYSDFREALIRSLNKDPVLQAWTHRAPDDPGIALLEGAAILGDILTFYQELYANEAYLRTAKWRESIADLVRLLGYRLSPGLGGIATFAFEVKGDKPVIVPAGFPLKAQLEELEQPAEFETMEEFEAIPALSKFHLYRPFHHPDITTGSVTFSVETSVLGEMGLKIDKGDRLMLVVSPTDSETKREVVVVAEIRERFERTEITLEGSWQSGFVGGEITAYKLGRSFRYFGYNAPPKETVIESGVAVQNDVSYSARVGVEFGSAIAYLSGVYYPLPNLRSLPLDQEVDDISIGSLMLVSLQLSDDTSGLGDNHFFERTITKVSSATLTRGSLTGGATVVELDSDVYKPGGTIFSTTGDPPEIIPSLIYTDIRTVEFHEVIGERLTFKSARASISTADGSTLYHYGDSVSYQQLDGRSVQLVRDDQVEQLVMSIDSASVGSDNQLTLRPLTLNPQLELFTIEDFPLDDPAVTVYGNLVEADQGKTEKEAVLGNGDGRQMFQTFKIPKAPLAYHISPGETPPEVPELQIYVNDRLWEGVPSFFGRGPKEEIYIVREDANGESWVQFGDGRTGTRLPSGVKNVKAIYRTGTGAFGALKEDTTVQTGARLNGLDKVQLPDIATGGSEPEEGDNAREAAPGKIQSLDRLVSLKDFESETLSISGVSKATAAWNLVDNVPAVVLTVLMETGRGGEIEAVRQTLNSYNKCRGPQRFPIIVHQGKLQYVYVDAVFALDPTFREEIVREAIMETIGVNGDEGNGVDGSRGLFGLKQRWFGQNEYATRIVGTIQNVEGVLWAKVTALGSLGESEDPSELALPAEPKPLSAAVACDGLHVLSLYKEHLQLSIAQAGLAGECG